MSAASGPAAARPSDRAGLEVLAGALLERVLALTGLESASRAPTELDDAAVEQLACTLAARIAQERDLVEERERLVGLETELANRDRSTATVTHALKAAAAVIAGWTHLLRQELDEGSGTVHEALEAIDANAERVVTLARQLRTVHALDEQAQAVSVRPVRIERFVTEVVTELGPRTAAHEVAVDVHHEGVVITDPTALELVLDHLVDNATRVAPPGSEIRIAVVRTPAGRVAIEVRDHGPGLPPDIDVFAPFSRGQGEGAGGIGLGLHIVKRLVHAMDGDVTAQDAADGDGTVFRVLLPAASAAAVRSG